MTLQLEIEPSFIPIALRDLTKSKGLLNAADLLNPVIVQGLIEEGRPPCIVIYIGNIERDDAACFVPAGNKKSSQEFTLSLADGRRAALLRNALQDQHNLQLQRPH